MDSSPRGRGRPGSAARWTSTTDGGRRGGRANQNNTTAQSRLTLWAVNDRGFPVHDQYTNILNAVQAAGSTAEKRAAYQALSLADFVALARSIAAQQSDKYRDAQAAYTTLRLLADPQPWDVQADGDRYVAMFGGRAVAQAPLTPAGFVQLQNMLVEFFEATYPKQIDDVITLTPEQEAAHA